MSSAPRNAILFARTDRIVFGLWYFQYALHARPDLVVVANDLLPFSWFWICSMTEGMNICQWARLLSIAMKTNMTMVL